MSQIIKFWQYGIKTVLKTKTAYTNRQNIALLSQSTDILMTLHVLDDVEDRHTAANSEDFLQVGLKMFCLQTRKFSILSMCFERRLESQ